MDCTVRTVRYRVLAALLVLLGLSGVLLARTPQELDVVVEAFKVETDDVLKLDLSYQGLDLYAPVPEKSTIDQDDRGSLSEMKRLVLYDLFEASGGTVLLTAIGSTGSWLMDPNRIKNDYVAGDDVGVAKLKHQGFYMEGMSDLDFVIMGTESKAYQGGLHRRLGQGRGMTHITTGELAQLEMAFIVDDQIRQLQAGGDKRRFWRQMLNVRASAPHPEKYITIGGKALYCVEHLGVRGAAVIPGAPLRMQRFSQWAAENGHTIGPFTAQFLYGGCCDMDYFMRHAYEKKQEPVKTVMQAVKYLERQAWMFEQAHAHADRLPDGLKLLPDRVSHWADRARQIRDFTAAAVSNSAWLDLGSFRTKSLALSGEVCMAAHALALEMGRELLWRVDKGKASDAQVVVLDDIAYDVDIVHTTRYHPKLPDWYEVHEHTVKNESVAFIEEYKKRYKQTYKVLVKAGRLTDKDKDIDTIEVGPVPPPPVVSLVIEDAFLDPEEPKAGDELTAKVTIGLDGLISERPDWSKYKLPEEQRSLLEQIAVWSWRAARTRMEISALMKQDAENRKVTEAKKYMYVSPYEIAKLAKEDLVLCEETIKEASEQLGLKAPKSEMGRFRPKLAPATVQSVDIYLKHLTETMQKSKIVMEAIRGQASAGLTMLKRSATVDGAPGELSQSSQRLQTIYNETQKKLDTYSEYLGYAEKAKGYAESFQKIRGGDTNEMSAKARELGRYLDKLAYEVEMSATDAVRMQHRITNEIIFFRKVRDSIPAGQQQGLHDGLTKTMRQWDTDRKRLILNDVPEMQERAKWLRRGSYFAASAAAALKITNIVTTTFNAYDELSTTDLSAQSENAIAGLVAVGSVIDTVVEYLPLPVLHGAIKNYAKLFVDAPKWASAFDSMQTMRYQGQGYDVRSVLTPKAYTGLMDANPGLSAGQFYRYNGPMARYNRLILFGHPTPDRLAAERASAAKKAGKALLVDPGTHRIWLIWDKSKDNGFLRLGPEAFERASLYAAWFRRVFDKQITGPQLHDLLIKKEVYVGGTFLGETTTAAQLESRAESIRRVDSLKYYLADITGKSQFERDELRRYYGMLDRAARRMAKQGFIMSEYDVKKTMEKVKPDPPVSGDWEKAMDSVPFKIGAALGIMINKGDEMWDSLSSGEQTRLDQAVNALTREKVERRVKAREAMWAEARAESPAGLTLPEVRLVHNDTFNWKGGNKKQDSYEKPEETRVKYTVAVQINDIAKGDGTYVCQAMIEGYEDSMATATVPFKIRAQVKPGVPDPPQKEEDDEEKELPNVSSGGLAVQCPPEPQPEAIASDLDHVETIQLPERWPEEYYRDDEGYHRVFYKVWWDESKSQLKSYIAYGAGRENLREAHVNKRWDRNGNPISVDTYQRDENGKSQRHGISEQWYPGGQKKKELVYVDDNQRASKWWNKEGILTSEGIDTGTTAWEKSYYDDGTPKEEQNFGYDLDNGWRVKHGVQKQWYENGYPKYEEEYKAGKQHGVRKWYRKDGKLSSEAHYTNGEYDGTMTRFDKQGRKREQRTYKKGKKDGPYRIWDENGAIVREANYKDDGLHGVSKSYQNGKLTWEIGYRNNKYHGDHKRYGPDGSLKEHLVYENGKLVKKIKTSWF